MKNMEVNTDISISLNDDCKIKVENEADNHIAVHLPDWNLVSTSNFRSRFNIDKINKLLHHMHLIASVYVNNKRVITLGNQRTLGAQKFGLVIKYFGNLFTRKK
jgi:hypothetical protein